MNEKIKRFSAFCLTLIMLAVAVPVSSLAATDWVPSNIKSVVFDAPYYAANNPDVVKVYGNASNKLYEHFLDYGAKEGRQGSPVFSAKYYLENNSDLKNAFGTNRVNAINHFSQFGYREPSRVTASCVNLGTEFEARVIASSGLALSYSGTNVNVKTATAQNKAQLWVFTRNSDGTYTIRNKNTGTVLDVAGASYNSGTNVQLYASNGTAAQRWYIFKHSNGKYIFRSKAAPSCVLDIYGGSTTSGANVQSYTYNGTAAQMFSITKPTGIETFKPVNLGEYFFARINGVGSGKDLSLSSSNTIINTPGQNGSQIWRFSRNSDGTYRIENASNGQSLCVEGNSGNSFSNVKTASNSTADSQAWFIFEVNGKYVFSPRTSFSCVIDVANNASADGTNVMIYTYNASTAQQFEIIKVNAGRENTVWFTVPAIPADVGSAVDLYEYNVQFKQNMKVVPKDEITWTSSDIAIDANGKVTPTAAGVYKLTAKSGTAVKTIYLIAKKPTSSEYVLYSNDFSSSDISDFTVVQKTNGSVSVADGKLSLSAKANANSFVRLLLPSFIGDFGDYTFSTNATITEKADSRRWMALMYRVQDNNYPYYQYCIRANAATSNKDGVEFSYMTNTNNSWLYHGKTSYTEAINASKNYLFKVDVYGNSATSYINGTKMLSTTALTDYSKGRVGLQVCGTTTVYDDVKVTIDFDKVYGYMSKYASVRDLDTNISLDAAMVTEITSSAQFDTLLTNSPAVAIMSIDSKLNVVNSNNVAICGITEAMFKLGGVVIPAFRVDSSTEATQIAKYLKANNIHDALIVAKDGSLIKKAQSTFVYVKGVYDATSAGITDLGTIRENTNASGSRICLLPSSMATQKNTAFLAGLATTVWYKSSDNSKTDLFKLITAGAHGVVTSNVALLESCMEDKAIFAGVSHVRPINVIGHRGIPTQAPENTIVGSKLAASYGANIIENDIYLTTDGVIVVMHDPTINRTTNGSGNIESMSYAQLQQYVVDYYGGYREKIPTLEDYFKALKGTGVNMFIEIKSQKAEIVPKLKALIEQYDILDQCGVITFHAAQLQRVRTQIPGISGGLLTSMSSVENILNTTSQWSSTYNPSQSGLTEAILEDCSYRGVSMWPWTIDANSTFNEFFAMGTWGITTNRSDYVKNYIERLYTTASSYTVSVGGTKAVSIKKETYSGATSTTTGATMFVVDGNTGISFDGSKISASKAGTSTVVFRMSYKLGNGTTVYVYTQPVKVVAS